MTVSMWLGLALGLSVCVNFVLVWFSREQSRSLLYVSENLGDLVEIIGNYKKHLRKVYSLEMFYGDENLKHLMEHTTAVVSVLQEEYGDIASRCILRRITRTQFLNFAQVRVMPKKKNYI